MSVRDPYVAVLGAAVGGLGICMYALYRKISAQARLLREAAARQQMSEFAAMYTRGLDRLDPELIRLPFTEDGMMDIPNLQTPVSVKDFSFGATDFLGKRLVSSMHNLSNSYYVFSADFTSAQSSIYFIANHFKLQEGTVINAGVYGRYCDSWVACPDGKFRIKYRKLIYDFQPEEWTKAIDVAKTDGSLVQKPSLARHENLGVRDKSDFDYKQIDFVAGVPITPKLT